jgi:hypothetical protein
MPARRRPDAVLIVHGIGEQVTNDTARSLAVALADPATDRVRSAADLGIDGAKQRVYSIVWDIDAPTVSPETHVSEGYWAYRFRDTTWSHVTGWLLPLVMRSRGDAPDRLKVGPAWLSNLFVLVAGLAGLLIVAGWWAAVPLGGWLADNAVAAALLAAGVALVLTVYVVVPHRGVPAGVLVAVVGMGVLVAVLQPVFGWLGASPFPDWMRPAAVATLVGVSLAALAVDVLTSVRVLAVATATLMLVLVGTATNQDDAATTVLALLGTAAAPWASAAAAAAVLPSLGDAARYFRDHPGNEEESRQIRRIVIDKLRELHRLQDGEPRFERVVVVGHSLGSVIAYDALNHFWAETNGRLTVGGPPECETCATRDVATLRLEAAAHDLVALADDAPPDDVREALGAYRDAQWDLSTSLRSPPCATHRAHVGATHGADGEPPWLVTDFVTLGSPLASASFLSQPGTGGVALAVGAHGGGRDHADLDLASDDVRRPGSWFESKLAAREYPSCPPLTQTAAALDPIVLLSDHPLRYPRPWRGHAGRWRHLHHAAAFAPTRWTNVYFDNDLVAGPVSGQLGRGILDVEVEVARPTPRNFAALFSHTSYWNHPGVTQLRAAAATSRTALADLVRLAPDVDTTTRVELATIEDIAWCGSSPAQASALRGLERLAARRAAAFAPARRAATWAATIDAIADGDAPDAAALRSWVEGVRDRHGDACVAVVAYGEVAFYRQSNGVLDRSGCRSVALASRAGVRRCRTVGESDRWPGVVEERDLVTITDWVEEFLASPEVPPSG